MAASGTGIVARHFGKDESSRAKYRQYLRSLVRYRNHPNQCKRCDKRMTKFSRGLVNPAPGVFDFEGYRDLKGFFELASEVGLWVILRPGTHSQSRG